jgi:glycine C-acetyltransferase
MYPVVPKGILLLRLIPSAVHTFEDIDETLAAFDAVHQKLKKGAYDNLDVPSVV